MALELVPGTLFQPIKEKETLSMRKLIGSVTGIKSAFAQIMILCVALELFGILGPFFMQCVMDMVLAGGGTGVVDLFTACRYADQLKILPVDQPLPFEVMIIGRRDTPQSRGRR